jgi:trans-2-enoyl-CoA reductase
MNFKAFAAIVLCTFSLAACKPNLKTIGSVDDDKLITPKTLADMGYDAFREKYLGQEVTVTDFYQEGLIGTFKKDKAQCNVAFSTKDKKSGKKFYVYIYILTTFQTLC